MRRAAVVLASLLAVVALGAAFVVASIPGLLGAAWGGCTPGTGAALDAPGLHAHLAEAAERGETGARLDPPEGGLPLVAPELDARWGAWKLDGVWWGVPERDGAPWFGFAMFESGSWLGNETWISGKFPPGTDEAVVRDRFDRLLEETAFEAAEGVDAWEAFRATREAGSEYHPVTGEWTRMDEYGAAIEGRPNLTAVWERIRAAQGEFRDPSEVAGPYDPKAQSEWQGWTFRFETAEATYTTDDASLRTTADGAASAHLDGMLRRAEAEERVRQALRDVGYEGDARVDGVRWYACWAWDWLGLF